MKKPHGDLVPQSTAQKVLGIKNHQTIGNWIKRGKISTVAVFGKRWVSLKECKKVMRGK